MRRAFYILICLLFSDFFAMTQVRVKEAVGRWELTRDISLAEAEENALFEAKRDALRRAGVEDEVYYSFLAVQGIDSSFYKNIYNRISWGEVQGIVQVNRKTVKKVYDESADRLFVEVRIDAKVKKISRRDPGLKLELDGLHNTYREGEILEFTCYFFKDCYLKIFVFDPVGGYQVYPNRYENDKFFKRGNIFRFPGGSDIEYVLKKNESRKLENNVLLVVATREYIPFIGHVDYESVLKWLFKIPLKERVEVWHNFVIE